MKSILISIQPQWVEKILNGEKTIEIRKTIPKCELPCKVYIYCTQAKPYLYRLDDDDNFELTNNLRPHEDCFVKDYNALNGKIVAEFTLKNMVKFDIKSIMFLGKSQELMQKSCLGGLSLRKYLGDKVGYSWAIDNLKIYDKPKELSEFSGFIPNNKCKKHENGFACDKCDAYDKEHETCLALYYCRKPIKRPPQSWCYVEELED